jgi:hypothetical protein
MRNLSLNSKVWNKISIGWHHKRRSSATTDFCSEESHDESWLSRVSTCELYPELVMPKAKQRDIVFHKINDALSNCLAENERVHPASEARIEREGRRKTIQEWREPVARGTPMLEGVISEAYKSNIANSIIYRLPIELLVHVDSFLESKVDRLAMRLCARQILVALSGLIILKESLWVDCPMRMRRMMGRDRFDKICAAEKARKLRVVLPGVPIRAPIISTELVTVRTSERESDQTRQPSTQASYIPDKDGSLTSDIVSTPELSTLLYACLCCRSAHPRSMFKENELSRSPEKRICFEEFPIKLCNHISLRHRELCRMLRPDGRSPLVLPVVRCPGHGDDKLASSIKLVFQPDRSVRYQGKHSIHMRGKTWTDKEWKRNCSNLSAVAQYASIFQYLKTSCWTGSNWSSEPRMKC